MIKWDGTGTSFRIQKEKFTWKEALDLSVFLVYQNIFCLPILLSESPHFVC